MIISKKCLIVTQVFSSLAFADLSIGDTLTFNATYSDNTGMSGSWTQANEVIDSISTNNDTTSYYFSVTSVSMGGFFEDPNKLMIPLIRDNKTKLVVLNSPPSGVHSNSKTLMQSKWILSEMSTSIFYKSIFPISKLTPIPMLDSGIKNQPAFNYTVRISDTLGMKWGNTENNKTAFYGQLVHYTDSKDTVGTTISTSLPYSVCDDVPNWIYSNAANPFNFISINTSSSIYPMNQGKMDMGEGCYKMRILNYKKTNGQLSLRHRRVSAHISRMGDSHLNYLPNGSLINPGRHSIGLYTIIGKNDSSKELDIE